MSLLSLATTYLMILVIDMTKQQISVGSRHKTNSYGWLEVINYDSWRYVRVRFIDTKYETVTTAANIYKGQVKDLFKPKVCGVGFIGEGNYTPSVNGEPTSAYTTWKNMLARCYSESSTTITPTYKDCSVCEEWHNYQNFAEWFENNHVDGFELDKDIKVHGNKFYSPETCLFVSRAENTGRAHNLQTTLYHPEHGTVTVCSRREFAKQFDLYASGVGAVLSGKRKQHKGWTIPPRISHD